MNILFAVYLHEIAIQAQGDHPRTGLFIDQSKGKRKLVCFLPAQDDDFRVDPFCLEEQSSTSWSPGTGAISQFLLFKNEPTACTSKSFRPPNDNPARQKRHPVQLLELVRSGQEGS